MPSLFLRQLCRILDFGVEIQLPVFQWVLREREKGGERERENGRLGTLPTLHPDLGRVRGVEW